MAKITLLTDFICRICNREFKNSKSLGRHLYLTHDMKSNDYTIEYLLNNEIPKCKCGCGKDMKIKKYSYYEYQSGHTPKKPESNDWKKDKDSEKYKAYFEKLSKSMKDYFRENPLSDEKRLERSIARKKFIEENPEIVKQMIANVRKARQKQKESGELKGENHWYSKITSEQKTEVIRKRMETYENMTDEEREIISKSISDGRKRYWKSLSPEQIKAFGIARSELLLNLPEDRKKEISKKMSDRRKKEMELLGNSDIFKPSYNTSTIPYIKNILNEKYKTIFIHAESEGGEFRVYDKELRRTYYADAFCPNLNLWIEFDEPNKFDNGILKETHVERENRIRQVIPNIEIVRIYFDKRLFNQNQNQISVEDSPLGGKLIVR